MHDGRAAVPSTRFQLGRHWMDDAAAALDTQGGMTTQYISTSCIVATASRPLLFGKIAPEQSITEAGFATVR